MALGAAIGCRDRKVILVQADGSGMYIVQALWSMALSAGGKSCGFLREQGCWD
jgi:thiamine pyrophosphate-dependent acetolactate synthase large subunit-like protein